ncbi:hypothetical protein [Streptomyces sp. NPDC127038]|uniref:hypothetical protein n=1 Tax=Streptomyces sp. NPDC127038 TaxID=3347114 RepID=UPI00366766A6
MDLPLVVGVDGSEPAMRAADWAGDEAAPRVGMQLGRVAHAALHHAACPVAVVPQRG